MIVWLNHYYTTFGNCFQINGSESLFNVKHCNFCSIGYRFCSLMDNLLTFCKDNNKNMEDLFDMF